MKIFLIGLMGSGKSVLGKKLSKSVNLPFIDLDEIIERQEGLTISEIFATKGEAHFRTLEAAALRKQSEASEFVISTGGGTPCFHDNMDFINKTGISFFLNTPLPEILKRFTQAQKKARPMLENVPDDELEEKLAKLLKKRLPFYQQAHVTLNGATATAWDILQHIHTRK